MKVLRALAVVLAMLFMVPSVWAADPARLELEAVFTGIAKDGPMVGVTLPAPWGAAVLKLADPAGMNLVGLAEVGDVLRASFTLDEHGNPVAIAQVLKLSRPVAVLPRLAVLGGSLLALVLVMGGVSRCFGVGLLVGVDNRYSNSQFQLATWFTTVATIYTTAVLLRMGYLGGGYAGGVGMTANLVAMTGLSAFSFGSAKAVAVQKADAAVKANVPMVGRAGAASLVRDLVTSDEDGKQTDLGDLQMVLVTLAAVGVFVVQAFNWLGMLEVATPVTLPDVDTTLLAGFGIGQGAYLAKKAAAPPGAGAKGVTPGQPSMP